MKLFSGRLSVTAGVFAAVVGAGVGPAGAASNSVTINAEKVGGVVRVDGTVTLNDQPFVSLGDDPVGDHALVAPGLGADLLGFSAATTAAGDLRLRWRLDAVPAAPLSGVPGFVYGYSFLVDDEAAFEVDASRVSDSSGPEPRAILWACADAACTPADQTMKNEDLPVVFDPVSGSVTVSVPASEIGVHPGSSLAPVVIQDSSVFIGNGVLSNPYLYSTSDVLDGEVAVFEAARLSVSLGLSSAGKDPRDVEYVKIADLAGKMFSGSLPSGSTWAGKVVYGRACYGAGNCFYGTSPAL